MTKPQPIVVVVGVVMECDSRGRGRGTTENTYIINGSLSSQEFGVETKTSKNTKVELCFEVM